MALTDCNLITGEVIDCADSIGGVDTIYITELQNKLSITSSSGTITAFTLNSTKKFWTYEMEKENAEAMSNGIRSVENGTTYYESTVSFTLKKMSAQKRNNLERLIKNRVMIIVKDNTGVYWLYGETKGMDLTTSEAKSGKAFGDLNGYSLSFTGKEPNPLNVVTSSLITTLTVAA